MNDKEQKSGYDSFVQSQRKTHQAFPDLSDKVMAAIQEAPEPKRPISFQAILKQLQGALATFPGHAWKAAAVFTVLILAGGFYLLTQKNTTPADNRVAESAHMAKGSSFTLKYLVKSRNGDTVLLANDTATYFPGDVFQAVYWSAQAKRAHLFLKENEVQCFTCDSLQGILLESAQGGYFPFAVELDSSQGEALFAAVVSDAQIDVRTIKKSIYEIMENPVLSPNTAGRGWLNKADGIRYFLFWVSKGKKDAGTGRK